MRKRRALLLCSKNLPGESLEVVLRSIEDLVLIGPWEADAQALARIAEHHPDIVLIAEADEQSQTASNLISQILERFPDLPVFYSTLAQNVVRVYTSHELPAQTTDLLETIRRVPDHPQH